MKLIKYLIVYLIRKILKINIVYVLTKDIEILNKIKRRTPIRKNDFNKKLNGWYVKIVLLI
jgi:hypothetical protein